MAVTIYMIREGELEEIQKPVFTTGDSYVVVDKEAQKVYVWLGSKCSVDEKGSAAVQARAIDEKDFAGNAKIITYDEGMEDKEFLVKLQGLKVLDKNLAKSMLKDVKSGEFAGQEEHVNALYKISSEEFEGGLDAIKFVQVPFEKASLDSDDCMIADLGVDIWIWQGKGCNVKEKTKTIQLAREFDAQRAGSQKPRVFGEGEDDENVFLGIFEGRLPTQDRATVDLKAEVFEDGPAKEGGAPEPAPAPKAEPKSQVMAEPSAHAPAASKGSIAPPSAQEKPVLIQKGGGRLQCPSCGNPNRQMIREVEDRSHIIMDYPIMYGKKYICGKCGSHWRREE